MDKKQIQEQRIKGYFIQAAKELLKGEGLKRVSVRIVADRAGYSYATLYNYFKDLNDLIFECVKEFQAECEEHVKVKTKKSPEGKQKIKDIVKAYVGYFNEYPGVFGLFFLERMGDLCAKKETSGLIYHSLDTLCDEQWKYLVGNGELTAEEAESKKQLLRFTITGVLVFYENRLQPGTYKEFTKLLDAQLSGILG
ncbi:MAG: TetR/AcrR family transcriptional regulator [Prevotellaceae bacterium]|jgi:AcrR family transcriptional regulator|nr:TetR/AcrR family transcriptional regulator [Prevotellaceae bacterium]